MASTKISMFFLGVLLLFANENFLWTDSYGVVKTKEKVMNLKYPERGAEDPLENSLNPVIANLEKNMVRVQGGSFKMGCTPEQGKDCDGDEIPVHEVTLSSYHIGKFEVTQEEWKAVMGSNPSHFKDCPKCPVERVSWYDIQIFLQKLNKKTGKDYRLPTEAEWEFAARGGNESKGNKYSGANHNMGSVGWYSANSEDKTQEVGTKRPNELGLYDMSGNVYEWCSDWYSTAYYANSPTKNPKGPSTGESKVFRGGAWYFLDWIYNGSKQNAYDTSVKRKSSIGLRNESDRNGYDSTDRGKSDVGFHRVSYRNAYVPSFRFYFIGFRLCRTETEGR